VGSRRCPLGFEVDLHALVEAAEGVNGTMADLQNNKVSDIGGSAADYGDGDLAGTVSDFCARWEIGVQHLVNDAEQVANRLYLSAAAHAKAERANIASLTGILQSRTVGELTAAAGTATAAVGKARDQAPQKPGFWSKVADFFEGLGHDAEKVGAAAVDDLASVGNAVISNPLADLGMVAGVTLAGVSAIGDGAGLVLDATGVGAVVGVPVNVISTAGVVAGAGLMMASGGDLASHAAGDDHVDPVNADSGPGDTTPSPDPQYTPGTPEYEARISELSQDPAKGGATTPASVREAQVGLQLEADGQVPGPITRAPLDAAGNDQGEFIDSTGQRWDVKSSPDLQPSYRPDAGQPIRSPQSIDRFTSMINSELAKGENVMLDPDGMTPGRLAQLQQVVADHPEWLGKVVWGS
jgi:hypothetical protein